MTTRHFIAISIAVSYTRRQQTITLTKRSSIFMLSADRPMSVTISSTVCISHLSITAAASVKTSITITARGRCLAIRTINIIYQHQNHVVFNITIHSSVSTYAAFFVLYIKWTYNVLKSTYILKIEYSTTYIRTTRKECARKWRMHHRSITSTARLHGLRSRR